MENSSAGTFGDGPRQTPGSREHQACLARHAQTHLVNRRAGSARLGPLGTLNLVILARLWFACHGVDEDVDVVLFTGRDETEIHDVVAGSHELDDFCDGIGSVWW